MTKPIIVLVLLFATIGSAQTDSVLVSPELRFAPSIRTIAVESSTYLFLYGANGATVDLDLLSLPSATVHSAGVRVNYQEYRRGFFLDYRRTLNPHAFITSVFIRGSHKKGNTRTDVILGMSSGDPRELIMEKQLIFGIEARTIVVHPIGSVFFRILGGPNGAAMQFGLAVGYVE